MSRFEISSKYHEILLNTVIRFACELVLRLKMNAELLALLANIYCSCRWRNKEFMDTLRISRSAR